MLSLEPASLLGLYQKLSIFITVTTRETNGGNHDEGFRSKSIFIGYFFELKKE